MSTSMICKLAALGALEDLLEFAQWTSPPESPGHSSEARLRTVSPSESASGETPAPSGLRFETRERVSDRIFHDVIAVEVDAWAVSYLFEATGELSIEHLEGLMSRFTDVLFEFSYIREAGFSAGQVIWKDGEVLDYYQVDDEEAYLDFAAAVFAHPYDWKRDNAAR